MTWNSIMGFISSLALFSPIFFILIFRLGTYRSFPILLTYYALAFIYNLMTEGYIKTNFNVMHNFGIVHNFLDVPLMLIFLTYFSTSAKFTRQLKMMAILFIVFDIAVILLRGFNIAAITIVLGPGIFMVFSLCVYLFFHQSKITVMHRKATGKTLIAAALVFAYGSYGIIYTMFYLIKTPYKADTFLVYFLVSTFSSIVLCTGIFFERKRIQRLHELKLARKELAAIYKDTNKISSFRPAMLDFDKETWD